MDYNALLQDEKGENIFFSSNMDTNIGVYPFKYTKPRRKILGIFHIIKIKI